ncbi:MAG TPA: type II toxin-antitoxin system VapC family toxin [Microthrixaceae bacterium]|nr:type II toxin-antitoxin system VapC family toxin [Microthrixaceae bacterium]
MILVDSDILIAHLRGVPDARSWLREARLRSPLGISVVTVAELTGGMRSAERREVWALLNVMRAEPVTELVARRAGELWRRFRRSHTGIGIADYLVAATALELGAELATLNVEHFPMFDDLRPPFEVPMR